MVPHKTPRRRVLGWWKRGISLLAGPCTGLTKNKEHSLFCYIMDMVDMGFGLTSNERMCFLKFQMIDTKFLLHNWRDKWQEHEKHFQ